MGWTVPKSWASGEILTAANMNTHVRDNLAFLYPGATASAIPYLMATNTSNQSFTADVEDSLSFDTIVEDNCSAWDGTNDRYVAPIDGIYLFVGTVAIDGTQSAVTRLAVGWGAGVGTNNVRLGEFQPDEVAPAENAVMAVTFPVRAAAGEFIAFRFSRSANGTFSPARSLAITWLHP